MNKGLFLAVDGGGTKTTVWIADSSGEVLGKATTGAMSLAANSPTEAVRHFLTAVKQAALSLGKVSFATCVIGLAGVDTKEEIAHAQGLFSHALKDEYSVGHCVVVNDILIALESGSQSENAICLISGTGSHCFGKNAQGEYAKTGGMDYLLSDQGSGFEIGQMVLRAAVKSYDGRTEKSILEKLVCEHFEISSIEQLKNKVYHPRLNKTQIGKLGKLCFVALEQSDAVANGIVEHALKELFLMVTTVLRRLHLEQTKTDLVLIGGIATDPHTQVQLQARLSSIYPNIQIIVPTHPPVYGALQLALKK